MASTASSSSTVLPSTSDTTPQAGPLPQKRGEIGFRASLLERAAAERAAATAEESAEALPERHPADTDLPSSSRTDTTSHETAVAPTPPIAAADASSTHKARKNALQKFLSFTIGGISLVTFIRFVFQLLFIAGTLAAWVTIIQHLNTTSDDQEAEDPSENPDALSFGGSGSIFVHVAFGVATLGQLLFLERCIFYMRAQRYMYKHPGSSLPRHGRSMPRSHVGMGLAPWNRPPLPTYAAALAQSGYGTGDVEDNAIAIPPPPAYGNTRGSTLMLAGFMRNSLRRGSAVSADLEAQNQRRMSQASRPDRPVSYRSTDSEWEQIMDAERSLRLAETLERLEESAHPAPQS